MRLAILDLTTQVPGVPRASGLIIKWLSPALPEARYTPHDICAGAPFPAPETFDGMILTGSEVGVYDHTPWMQPLRDMLQDLRARRLPCFGICFGHQIMADTWGGRAEKAAIGKVIGARDVQVAGQNSRGHFWHQDQVTQCPPEARNLATAPHCPIAMLSYDFPALSVQFHPEFSAADMRLMFKLGLDHFITADEAAEALVSIDEAPAAPDLMRDQVGAFFRAALSPPP